MLHSLQWNEFDFKVGEMKWSMRANIATFPLMLDHYHPTSVDVWQSFCKFFTFDTQKLEHKKSHVNWSHFENRNDTYY